VVFRFDNVPTYISQGNGSPAFLTPVQQTRRDLFKADKKTTEASTPTFLLASLPALANPTEGRQGWWDSTVREGLPYCPGPGLPPYWLSPELRNLGMVPILEADPTRSVLKRVLAPIMVPVLYVLGPA